MTIIEQHYDFDLKIDKVASFAKENFNVAEKDWLLNEAQDVFVKQRMTGHNPHGTGFEFNQKRIDDLSTIHIKFPEQPGITPSLVSGVYEVTLSSLVHPYLKFTRGQVDVVQDNCPNKKVSLREMQNDDLNDSLDDPYAQSSLKDGVLFNFGKSSLTTAQSSIYLYPGDLTLGDVYIEYLKQPRQMFYGGYDYIDGTPTTQVDCELPEHTHIEIVDIAVAIAAGIIEHPTYVQLKQQKVFQQE